MGYLDAHLPSGNSKARSVKTDWSGLDRKHTQDTGYLSRAENIVTTHLPFLRVAEENEVVASFLGNDVYSVHDLGDGAFAVTRLQGKNEAAGTATLMLVYVTENGVQIPASTVLSSSFPYTKGTPISVVPFNVYSSEDDNIVTATYDRRILIYPFCMSFTRPTGAVGMITLTSFNTEDNAVPQLDIAAVHQGRVFGVKDGKVFASAWNNYADWTLPNADDADVGIAEGGAWVSATQSDINASGEFTALAVYDNHVVAFKRNFMHQIYNNKNPFRIADIARIGALSQRAVCECNRVLFFVSEDGIYSYTGGYPECLSDNLEISSFEGAVLGADDRVVYCYIPSDGIFTYDTVSGSWGMIEHELSAPIYCAKRGNDGIFAANRMDGTVPIGEIKRFGGGPCGYFLFETDMSYGGELIEKRILRIRLQVALLSASADGGDSVRLSLMKDGKMAAYKMMAMKENKTYVLSLAVRRTCAFGHKIRVEGYGNVEIRYLQIEYEEGGQRYV